MSLVQEVMKKSLPELRKYAKERNIDLYGVKTKQEILEVILSFIPKEDEQGQPKKKYDPNDKVAIYSPKNIFWNGVGTLSVGYNIVSREASEMWLTRKGIREATPQEVAKHYGKK